MWDEINNFKQHIEWQNFKCLRCGSCCKWEGEVRLLQNEPDIIAGFLQMSVTQFIDRYTRLARDRGCLTLTDNNQGHCIFFVENKGCLINSVKPRQCQDFPQQWRCDGWYQHCAGLRQQRDQGSDSIN